MEGRQHFQENLKRLVLSVDAGIAVGVELSPVLIAVVEELRPLVVLKRNRGSPKIRQRSRDARGCRAL